MCRVARRIHNGTLESFVCFSMNLTHTLDYEIFFFINCFSKKVICAFLASENMKELLELNTFKLENDVIFQIIDQIKVSGVPL